MGQVGDDLPADGLVPVDVGDDPDHRLERLPGQVHFLRYSERRK